MANPDCATEGAHLAARCHTVFIDTSFDTHMVMVVGEADTVADFKNKLQDEHVLCFPDIGEISINALQVKRRGFLYHLSDSMYVRSAFDGVKSKWFLYVDAFRKVKCGLEICGPFSGASGILRCLERKALVDGSDDRLNEPKKTLRDIPKVDLLHGKDIGNVTGDLVRKVLSDLEIEFEQTGDDHRRTFFSDTNKRVKPEVYGSTFPDNQCGRMETSHRKRKAKDSENQIDKYLSNGDASDGHDKMSNPATKKCKIQKKEKSSSKRSKTKTNSSTFVASDKGAQNDDTIEQQTVPINSANNNSVDMLCGTFLEGQEALHSGTSTDAMQESENQARYEDPKRNQSHSNRMHIDPTNELSNGDEGMHLDRVAEGFLPDRPHKCVSEDSLMPKVPIDGKQSGELDFTADPLADVPLKKSERGNKQVMKKKKNKAEALFNQLSPTAPISAEDDERENIKDTTGSHCADAVEKSTVKYLGVQNMEDVLQDSQKFSTDQTYSIEENQLLSQSTEKLQLENQKSGDPRESDRVVEAHEALHNYGVVTPSKSHKKGRKVKKGSVEAVVSDGPTSEISADKTQKVVPTTNEASCPDPFSEALLADLSRKGVNEGSSKPDVTMNASSVGDQESGRPDAIDALPVAPLLEVHFESSNPTKRKKKKTKATDHQNQQSSTISLPEENNVDIFTRSADVGKEPSLKQFAALEMENAVQDHQKFATDQTTSVGGNELEPMSAEKVSSESQKPADSNQIEPLVESEVLHRDGAMVHLKSGKKAKKKRKSRESVKKKKAKTATEVEEITKEEVSLNQNVENTGSNLERTNISHLGLDLEATDEGTEKATRRRSDLDDLRDTEGSDMQVAKVREASAEASQVEDSSNLENHVPTVEKDNKKSKLESSAINPSEIQSKEKVPFKILTRSTGHSNSRDKSVEADEGDLANYRSADGVNQAVGRFKKDNGKEAPSTRTFTGAADVLQLEGKHLGLIAVTTSVDDDAKGKKLRSATNEINFIDYFVPSQHKTEAVASRDAGIVNGEWINAKGKTDEATMKKKSKDNQDGKKSEVESSQESLSMHADVLHSDTESFRVPKNRAPQSSCSSGKQKLKSSHKRFKPCGSNDLEVPASHSPSASDAQKSKLSTKEAKMNNNDSKAVARCQLEKNAKTFAGSNSTCKSSVDIQLKKSKQLATKKSSTAEVRKAGNGAFRRKTLLSTNIFKDDNDESSEDDEGVDSGPSAGTALDDFSASEVSEMEDNMGFTTPQTVGQRRRAAEADNDSSMKEYTLEMLRKATLLEKAKRTAAQMTVESERQLDEFVPDSQADPNPS